MQYATDLHDVGYEPLGFPFHSHIQDPEPSLQDSISAFHVLPNGLEPFREMDAVIVAPIRERAHESKRLQEPIVCK